MSSKKVVLQIFTGGFKGNNLEFNEIKDKLSYVLKNIKIEKVIMGWCIDKDLYIRTKELLKEYNTKLYLWIPVFSEIGLLKNSQLLVDYNLNEIESYELCEDENFEFYCPNSKVNINNLIQVYEENFSNIEFDGVFLDKIRYGSFSNKLSGVFNCFCHNCMKIYEEENIDVNTLKEEMKKIRDGYDNYQQIPFNIKSYEKGKYKFGNEIWEKFFAIKSKNIYNSVLQITQYFRKLDMKVGIDTFSPFISYFAGQDLEKLQNACDFIKPMIYRITKAPAGLPFESDNLVKETIKLDVNKANDKYLEIIGVSNYSGHKYPLDFVKKELKYMTENLNCSIYAGIEINRKEDIAPVYPNYIKENIINLNELPIEGYVLSWDLLSAPRENIDEVIKHLK